MYIYTLLQKCNSVSLNASSFQTSAGISSIPTAIPFLMLHTALSISSGVKGPLFMYNSQCTILDISSFSVILGHPINLENVCAIVSPVLHHFSP